jgi:phosphoglycerol transferase
MLAHWRVALLALVAGLIWCAHYDRWTAESWQIPTDYRGDSLEILARIEAASEGDTIPLRAQWITRLGAPFGANWSAYPASDLLLVWVLGQIARGVGVFAAANLALLLASVSAAVAFYGCARWLRHRWEWAFAGALLFAFTFQTFSRGLPHLFLVFSWTVPLALLVCGLVAGSHRLRLKGWMGVFCLGTAAAIGAGNPYTLFLFLQLLGWALVAQWFGDRRAENLQVGLIAMGVAGLALLATQAPTWLHTTDTAATSPLVRNYGATERYALKPIELVMPPSTHRWESLAFFGHRYLRWSDWRTGEAFAPYLGLIGIVGFVWLGVATWRAMMRRRRIPGIALPAGWVLAFSSVGGVTNVVAFFTGILVFRATNRFSIFLSAIVLLFLAAQLSRLMARRPRSQSLAVAALVALVGLRDQLPTPPGEERQQFIAQRVARDRELGRLLENAVKPGGMVFQLPVLVFPESEPAHQLGDYEHFRPYLATRSLRFSYGALRGRSRGRWQRELAGLPTPKLVERLESYGFSALYFNRQGFSDRGEKLMTELMAMGRTRKFEGESGEQVVVLLEPKPKPRLPFANTLTFGRGWHSPEPDETRWAYGNAALSYYNPQPKPVDARVRLWVSAADERQLRVVVNGKETLGVNAGPERQEVEVLVTLRPGINRIDLVSARPAIRMGHERGQLRSLALHDSVIEIVGETTEPSS